MPVLSDTTASAAVRPPRLQYEIYRLDNGLTVILSEDHSTPIVHVELWYHVGSKNERPGRTGFAHLFEHMMFQGSKNVEPEGHMSFISAIGGQTSAYTTEDATVYYQTAPAHYLPLLLWLEADRMATLRIDDATFQREREVVKEERLTRVDNPPYGRLPEIIYQHAFTTHPYKHQTIGSMEDLDAASIEDVREFYRTYYVPSNATLTIVGDFDPREARELVAQYFGRIPKPKHEVPRDIPMEPPMKGERRVTVEEPWPLATVVIAYHIPHDGHPDSYPLHIATKILSDGRSSRLYRSLVYEKRLAYAAFGGGNILEHPNLFFAVARVQPGRSPAEVEKALIEELDRLRNEPVTEHELQRAKNQFARDYILNRESIASKASQLAHAAVIHDDITTADGEFEIFANMTPADIQRAARAYFRPENRLVLTVVPRGPATSGRESR
ncbi:MAG TPA: pitrilysin family protein [Vicinamibacterales bacterium]|nr:pitrilysin family protein [Vicinamibacterales bacterium]